MPTSARSIVGRVALSAAVVVAVAPVAVAAPADQVRRESFELLNAGVAAVNRGDYKEAVEKLRRCAAMALNSFRAHYYLGLALNGDRRYSEAVEALKIALDLDPTHLQAHTALGDAFLRQGDTDEAEAEYYRALKLRPEYPQALDGIARVHEARADDVKAEQYYRRAIESNRGYADAYTHLGDLYLRLDRLDEAVRLLVEAVSIRPDFGAGLNRLALAYSRLGLHNEAVSTIQEAIELEPKASEHRGTLGHIQLDLGLLAGAQESFDTALELDPGHPWALVGTAEIARRQGDYDGALADLDEALADDRIRTSWRKRLESIRAEVSSERDRIAEVAGRIENGEGTPADYRAVAAIYASRLMWEEAAEYQAFSEPVGAELERLAYYLFRAGAYREAHRIYAEVAGREPSADLEVNAGVALARLGDDLAAYDAYERALRLTPDHLLARLYQGNALLRLGREEEAAAAYKAYLDGGGQGETAERARRILEQLAPETLGGDKAPEKPDIPALVEDEEPTS
jgi:tetratricopeptide (TPR) repeat protein